jgi:hypothetical protein
MLRLRLRIHGPPDGGSSFEAGQAWPDADLTPGGHTKNRDRLGASGSLAAQLDGRVDAPLAGERMFASAKDLALSAKGLQLTQGDTQKTRKAVKRDGL